MEVAIIIRRGMRILLWFSCDRSFYCLSGPTCTVPANQSLGGHWLTNKMPELSCHEPGKLPVSDSWLPYIACAIVWVYPDYLFDKFFGLIVKSGMFDTWSSGAGSGTLDGRSPKIEIKMTVHYIGNPTVTRLCDSEKYNECAVGFLVNTSV